MYKELNVDLKKELLMIRDLRILDGSVFIESLFKKIFYLFFGFLIVGGKKVVLFEEFLKVGRDIMRRLIEDELIFCILFCYLVNVEIYLVFKWNCEVDILM